MKNIKYLLLIFILFISFNVNAINNCDSKEYTRLKELAKKVEFDYDYKVVDGYADFSIHAVNLNRDLLVLIINDYFSGDYREFKGDSEGTLSGFNSGERVVVTIKGFVPNACSGVTVYTKTVKLPYYNRFYDEELCNGNEDFKYCKVLLDNNITQNDFTTQFDLYLKNKTSEVIEDNKQEENKNYELLYIIGGGLLIIVIISIVVTAIVKRRNKYKL